MKNRILIIDDNKDFLDELALMLSDTGYDVDTASGYYSAFQSIKKRLPDAILLDLKMPGTSGFEIAAVLRNDKRTADIPIVAMSAFYTLKEHEYLSNICGITKFLKKPVRLADINSTMDSIFEKLDNNVSGDPGA